MNTLKKRINHKPNQKTKKQFLYNSKNPNKSFDIYSDQNPSDTIHIKYTTIQDVKNTIDKLEKLYKNKKISSQTYMASSSNYESTSGSIER